MVRNENDKEALLPTIVTVPCFSGAPWNLEELQCLSDIPMRTMRLPEAKDDVEEYADFVGAQVTGLERYVLVGDSFGAVVSLALAVRQPPGLRALILSGGFAANPVRNPLMRARIRAARFLPGPLYRAVTLRLHAASLASPFDRNGEVDWPKTKIREFFLENTPFRSYVARAKAALGVNYLDRLRHVQVPTLLITPSYDRLIGEKAAAELLEGIRDSKETVLDKTGHMLRFTHPKTYSGAIRKFLEEKLGKDPLRTCGKISD